MFYNFLFRNLVSQCLVFNYTHAKLTNYCLVCNDKENKVNTCYMLMSQVKNVPIPCDEPQTLGKPPSLKHQGSRYITQEFWFRF